MTVIALFGNPNSGKTTLFNELTGTHQRVGNWPGVTVERKTGEFRRGSKNISVTDLPGTYSLEALGDAVDERIARDFITGSGLATGEHRPDLIVNVIDASSLARGLYLTTELLNTGLPIVVALNMIDVADHHGIHIDASSLSQQLGCPIIPIIASRGDGLAALQDAIETAKLPNVELPQFADPSERYGFIDAALNLSMRTTPIRRTLTDRIDAVALNRYLAFPIFLAVMYLMFMFAINIGSAFIDLFDGVGNVVFVEAPRMLLQAISLPDWLVVLVTDGVGGGLQLVGTFIPVIGCLFLALSFLEDSGYMGRVAFIVDRLLRRLGLPGKAFVPLIVGFGCNVPAIMATRTLDNEPDRILTTIMAPYMSCGARLTVYALFAAAFFPSNGQNIVFALYLIGICAAIFSALIVRRYLVRAPRSEFVLELPAYHLPTLKGLILQTWQRLKGFILRAGKAIVGVVIILNVVSSVGVDGSFGNQDSEKSFLSEIGRSITPIFKPMGISEDNWPATVGIFTGIFAKEVVVGTLDALYSPTSRPSQLTLTQQLMAALRTVPDNLSELGGALADPLGVGVDDYEDLANAADAQSVRVGTLDALQRLFDGQLGAFSYLLFVLLYMPCVATIGVIVKELGSFWAIFSTSWSVVMAYTCAVLCYQLGSIAVDPVSSLAWSAGVTLAAAGMFFALIKFGQRHAPPLIPLVNLE
jgi:ferrous iron transport protein B